MRVVHHRQRMACGLILSFGFACEAAAQNWEVRGRLSGPEPGWYGAIVSIPALRVGTVSGDVGNFVIRAAGVQQCYELLIRTRGAMVTYYRFLAPERGILDLGDIPLRRAPPRGLGPSPTPRPEPRDTLGSCRPAYEPPPEAWPVLHARVVGHFTRAGEPLRGARLDLHCGYNDPYYSNHFSQQRQTDSTGRFDFDAVLSFPQDQALADGNQVECHIRHFFPGMNDSTSSTVTFGPVSAPPPVNRVEWMLPPPSFSTARVVGPAGDSNHPLRLPGTAAFRPGVVHGPQSVSLEILPRPNDIVTPQYTAGLPRGEFLPIAVRVSTGRKVSTIGSSIYLLLPPEVAASIRQGSNVRAFGRVPRSTDPTQDDYLQLGTSYFGALHLLQIDLRSRDFTDLRNPEHWFEALVVISMIR